MKRIKKVVLIGFLLLVCIVALFLWKGEEFLIISSPAVPSTVDAVVVLAGALDEDMARVEAGVAIFEEKKAHFLILPCRHKGTTWSGMKKMYKIKTTLPDSQVQFGEMKHDSRLRDRTLGGTYMDAKDTIQMMLGNGLRTAVIISSDYHMRRARLAFECVRGDLPLQFYYKPVYNDFTRSSPWWSDRQLISKVLLEYKKLIGAFFLYR